MGGRGDSLKQDRLARVGESLATGKHKTLKGAMLDVGLSESTANQPKKNGYDATSAMVAYEKKKLGKKGFEKAAAQAREMLADALEDDNVPYGDRLKLAGWLVEHDLKRKKELGDDSQLGPDMATVLRFRLAIMRAVQKGIMLGVAEPDRAVQVSGRLGDKMLELAKLVQEEL